MLKLVCAVVPPAFANGISGIVASKPAPDMADLDESRAVQFADDLMEAARPDPHRLRFGVSESHRLVDIFDLLMVRSPTPFLIEANEHAQRLLALQRIICLAFKQIPWQA